MGILGGISGNWSMSSLPSPSLTQGNPDAYRLAASWGAVTQQSMQKAMDTINRRKTLLNAGAPKDLVDSGVFDNMDQRQATIAALNFKETEDARQKTQASRDESIKLARDRIGAKDPELLSMAESRLRDLQIHPDAMTDALKNKLYEAEMDRQSAFENQQLREASRTAARGGEGSGGKTMSNIRAQAASNRAKALRDIDISTGLDSMNRQQNILSMGLAAGQYQQNRGDILSGSLSDRLERNTYETPQYEYPESEPTPFLMGVNMARSTFGQLSGGNPEGYTPRPILSTSRPVNEADQLLKLSQSKPASWWNYRPSIK